MGGRRSRGAQRWVVSVTVFSFTELLRGWWSDHGNGSAARAGVRREVSGPPGHGLLPRRYTPESLTADSRQARRSVANVLATIPAAPGDRRKLGQFMRAHPGKPPTRSVRASSGRPGMRSSNWQTP